MSKERSTGERLGASSIDGPFRRGSRGERAGSLGRCRPTDDANERRVAGDAARLLSGAPSPGESRDDPDGYPASKRSPACPRAHRRVGRKQTVRRAGISPSIQRSPAAARVPRGARTTEETAWVVERRAGARPRANVGPVLARQPRKRARSVITHSALRSIRPLVPDRWSASQSLPTTERACDRRCPKSLVALSAHGRPFRTSARLRRSNASSRPLPRLSRTGPEVRSRGRPTHERSCASRARDPRDGPRRRALLLDWRPTARRGRGSVDDPAPAPKLVRSRGPRRDRSDRRGAPGGRSRLGGSRARPSSRRRCTKTPPLAPGRALGSRARGRDALARSPRSRRARDLPGATYGVGRRRERHAAGRVPFSRRGHEHARRSCARSAALGAEAGRASLGDGPFAPIRGLIHTPRPQWAARFSSFHSISHLRPGTTSPCRPAEAAGSTK